MQPASLLRKAYRIFEARLNKYPFFLASNLMFFVMGTFGEAISIDFLAGFIHLCAPPADAALNRGLFFL